MTPARRSQSFPANSTAPRQATVRLRRGGFRAAGRAAHVLLYAAAVVCTGCNGHARVTLIPLNTQRLTSTADLDFDFSPQACYWWTDEQERLQVAMKAEGFSPLGDLTRRSLELSLVLGRPPKTDEVQFRIGGDTARAIWHRGAFHLKMKALRGIVAARRASDTVIVGRFRLVCASAKFEVLRGWRGQSQVLLQGEFSAVRNRAAGEPIVQRSEVDQPRGGASDKAAFEPGG